MRERCRDEADLLRLADLAADEGLDMDDGEAGVPSSAWWARARVSCGSWSS